MSRIEYWPAAGGTYMAKPLPLVMSPWYYFSDARDPISSHGDPSLRFWLPLDVEYWVFRSTGGDQGLPENWEFSGRLPAPVITSDATLAKQNEILSKFAEAIIIDQPVSITGKINSPVIIGDDYLLNNSRAFTWTIAAIAGATIAGSSCKLVMTNIKFPQHTFSIAGSIAEAEDGKWRLTFEIPKETTEAFRPGSYFWSVEVTDEHGAEITVAIPKKGNFATFMEKAT